jgi:hypothetical protein
MMAELGSAKIRRAGPGEEITPNPTAAIKSANPMIFQVHKIGRALVGCRHASHATGKAVAPTKMSPQPANRSERRGQTAGRVKNDKTDTEQANRVQADKQPERYPMKTLAQRLRARDNDAKGSR